MHQIKLIEESVLRKIVYVSCGCLLYMWVSMFCHYKLYVCTLFVMCMYACVGDCTLLIMDCICACALVFSSMPMMDHFVDQITHLHVIDLIVQCS